MQDRIQLNREEIVGDGTALSNINPLTNTKSVDDKLTGESLDVTINRIWNAINNKLSRVVNSVNGKDGIVVITAKDIGLENVTNVSFSTIKDWVLDELLKEFGFKTMKLFDTYNEFIINFEAWKNDRAFSGIPFYIRIGGPEDDTRSQIGFTRWDDGESQNQYIMMPINTIYNADKSIIYNENINGKDLTGGQIGVNIWTEEDALKIYEGVSKAQSGLYIDKEKITSEVKFFECIYGNGEPGDTNALIYTGNTFPPGSNYITIYMNDMLVTDPIRGSSFITYQTFKIHDLVISNFSDANCRTIDGSLKNEFMEYFIKRESCIGSITAVEKNGQSFNYTLRFYTLKPYVGKGLTFINTHTQDGRYASMIGLEFVNGYPMLETGAKDNLSGLNAFSGVDVVSPESDVTQTHITVTPFGVTSTETLHSSNALFVSPDFSLSVIPYNTFSEPGIPMTNWPIKNPPLSRGITNQDFFGVNLLKRIPFIGMKSVNMSGLRVFNNEEEISNADLGKRDSDTEDKLDGIINHVEYVLLTAAEAPASWGADLLSPLYYSDDHGTVVEFTNIGTPENPIWRPEYQPNTYYIANTDSDSRSTGGLAVNVGRFLEIGTYVGYEVDADRDSPINDKEHYYDGGKVNLRVDDTFLSDTNGDNRLTLKLSQYKGYSGKDTNETLGGGLTYSPGYHPDDVGPLAITPGLTINRGLGLRMSHYNKTGQIPNDAADKAFLATSVIDTMYTSDDIGTVPDDVARGYGGLRYYIGDQNAGNTSAVGLRVNDSVDTYGHQLRLGDKAIGIDERNVVQVQRYRESDDVSKDTNPLVIKGWDEDAIYPYVKSDMRGIREAEVYEDIVNLPGNVGNPYAYPNTFTSYYVKSTNKHYIWQGDELTHIGEYKEMFVMTNDKPVDGEENRVYVERIIDNTNHTFVGKAYMWDPGYTVNLPGSWDPSTQQYVDDPAYAIDAVTSSMMLAYYSAQATRSRDGLYEGYYHNGEFYIDQGNWQVPLPEADQEDKNYIDISTPYPEVVYKYRNGAYEPIVKKPGTGGAAAATHEDLIPYDLNHDGMIDAVDGSIALKFYAFISTIDYDRYPQYRGKTSREQLALYLKEFRNIEETETGYVLLHSTDPDGSFIPGLDININGHQGVTTDLYGDIRNSVSVKIYDRTVGIPNCATDDGADPPNPKAYSEQGKDMLDPFKLVTQQGGLRFNAGGYLGVRVNRLNSYNATTPVGRGTGDYCRNKAYKGGDLRDNDGTKGLRIYSDNVLGIQLDVDGKLDNGQLAFDEYGCLIISPQYHGGGGGGEFLTITDTASHTIQYNGSEAINITLGPGLILEPDDTPPNP